MPAAIRKAVAAQTRPSPVGRKDMAKVVVDQMQVHDPNPTRAICHTIARQCKR